VKPAVKLLDQLMKAGLVSRNLKAVDLVKALIGSGLMHAELLARPGVQEALLDFGREFDAKGGAAALPGQGKAGRPKNSAPYLEHDERLLIEGAFRHAFRNVNEADLLNGFGSPEDGAPEQNELLRMGLDFVRKYIEPNTPQPHEIMHELALHAAGTSEPQHRRKRLVDRSNKLDMRRHGLQAWF